MPWRARWSTLQRRHSPAIHKETGLSLVKVNPAAVWLRGVDVEGPVHFVGVVVGTRLMGNTLAPMVGALPPPQKP